MEKYTAKFYISEDSHHTIAFQFNSMIFHEKSSNFVYICMLAYSVFQWKTSTAYCVKYLREGVHMSSQNRFCTCVLQDSPQSFFELPYFIKIENRNYLVVCRYICLFVSTKTENSAVELLQLVKLVDKIWFFFSVELLNLFYGTKCSKVYSQ